MENAVQQGKIMEALGTKGWYTPAAAAHVTSLIRKGKTLEQVMADLSK